MSVKKIAQLTGLSVATVSRVINDDLSVKADNRKHILEAIAAIGYQPNVLARQLRMNKSSAIVLSVPDGDCTIVSDICRGVYAGAGNHSYSVFTCKHHDDLKILNLIERRLVSCTISVGNHSVMLAKKPYPLISCVSAYQPQLKLNITINNFHNHSQLFQRIFMYGYRKIGVISSFYKPNLIIYLQSLTGLLPGKMHLSEIDFPEEILNGCGSLTEKSMAQLLDMDCLITLTDNFALSIKFHIIRAGLSVPVFFLSGRMSSQDSFFSDGGIINNFYDIGLQAANAMLSRLNKGVKGPESQVLSGNLIANIKSI